MPGRLRSPDWRKDAKAVEILSDSEWVETSSDNEKLPLKIILKDPMLRLVTHINSTSLPFGGNRSSDCREIIAKRL
jgi:hypothetical protein